MSAPAISPRSLWELASCLVFGLWDAATAVWSGVLPDDGDDD